MAASPKSKGGRRQAPAAAASIRELAAALDLSHTAVAKWVRDDRWPFGRRGPWDVAAAKAWAAKTLAGDPATGSREPRDGAVGELSPVRQVDLALKLTRRDTLKFKLDVEKGLYHRVDECEARLVRQVHDVKSRLLSMADSLPFDADGRAIVKGRLLEILQVLAGG